MGAERSRIFVGRALGLALAAVLVFSGLGRVSADGGGHVIYVRYNATGSNNGTSWANAYKSLQSALTAADRSDRIWVAKGTYKPTKGTDRTISFGLKDGVAVYGGFAGMETSLSQRQPAVNVTVLSGDIGVVGDASDNSYWVVVGYSVSSTAILDGLTIKAGNANGPTPYDRGGGMYISSGSPTLKNLTFSGNQASNVGGGIYNGVPSGPFGMYNLGGSPTLTNVTFKGNMAGLGGGMYNTGGMINSNHPNLTNVTFSGNTAAEGGGMYNFSSNPTLTHVTFRGNSATEGGAMYIDGGGTYTGSFPTLTDVTFRGNTASTGGGMYNAGGPTLINVTFSGNTATNGGGIYNVGLPMLTEVTFSDNTAYVGGGMYNLNNNPTLTNVTFSANTATNGGGMYNGGAGTLSGSSPNLTNVTFRANTATEGGGMYNLNNNPTLTNVTFSGNKGSGAGMYNDASSPTLTNVTFSGNVADDGLGGIYNVNGSNPSIDNSVFWGDGSVEIENSASAPIIRDSIVAGGCPAGSACTHVLSADPILGTLQDNGGYTQTMALGAGSAAIDAGGINAACATTDQRGAPRPQGSACDMGAYEVTPSVSFTSLAAQDGWVLESTETSGQGGTIKAAGQTFKVGDLGSRQQYRAILSFSTGELPDNVVIVSAALALRRQSVNPPGTNPFNILQGLLIDVRKGFFGTKAGLQPADFRAAGDTTVGPLKPRPDGALYTISLPSSAYPYINTSTEGGGLTQLRLRFKLDDNNDATANLISFFSGNHPVSEYWPTLVVTYYVP